MDCAVDELDWNTTILEQYNYYDSTTFIILLVENHGSITAAVDMISPCGDQYPDILNFLIETEIVQNYTTDGWKDLVAEFDVSVLKYRVAAVVAFLGGLCVALYIAGVLIPSCISTVLKLRSGVIPTLRDREFQRYRVALDTATVLLGSCFWGAFFSSIGTMVFLFGLVRLPSITLIDVSAASVVFLTLAFGR